MSHGEVCSVLTCETRTSRQWSIHSSQTRSESPPQPSTEASRHIATLDQHLTHGVRLDQCFPWCVICETAHLTLFSCRFGLFCKKKKNYEEKKMSASQVLIAYRKKITTFTLIKRRLYGNQCAGYIAIIQILLFVFCSQSTYYNVIIIRGIWTHDATCAFSRHHEHLAPHLGQGKHC